MPRTIKKTIPLRGTAGKILWPKKLPGKSWFLKLAGLLILVALIGVLLWKNKNLFVVALVNNQPVFRASLNQQLTSRYGDQTLDEMVGEMLIRQAASKNNIKVTKAETDAKLAEIEKTLNGKMTLQDALTQQGDTMESFRSRVELQLILERLTAGQTVVSEQEVIDYLDKNKTSLVATDEAGMRAEARQTLLSEKQNTALHQYFTDLRSQAKIVKFL